MACGLLAENLEAPQPPQPEELRRHMLNYLGAVVKLLARTCRIVRDERVPFALVVDWTVIEQRE